MSIVRAADLMGAAVSVLTAGGGVTDAGPRVYAPRDWPSWDAQYPVIFVSVPREHKQSSVGRGLPAEFYATATLRLSLRVRELASAGDLAAGASEHALDTLQAQIEAGLVNHPALWALNLQQFVSIETQSAFDATGAQQLGARLMDVALEYYQGDECFDQPPSADLTEVKLAMFETAIEDGAGQALLDSNGGLIAIGDHPDSPIPGLDITFSDS